LNVAQARATRLGDTAALFQALGGGWWHRVDKDKTAALEPALANKAAD